MTTGNSSKAQPALTQYLVGVDLAVRVKGGYLCGECAGIGAGLTSGYAQTGLSLPIDGRCLDCGGEIGHVERYTIPLKGK